MRRVCAVLVLVLAGAGVARGHGLLIPEEKSLPPLAMVTHKVAIQIEDQVAVTSVEQVFRNHTDRQLEATYVFPVPKGASVNRFTMTVDGKEQAGELLEADKARTIYTDIVRRTQDPGLLEYLGNNLFRLRVFPILPRSDQKVTLRYTSVATRDAGLVEYTYPLKTDGKATRTLQTFNLDITLKSQHPILNVYSPTHAINVNKSNDRTATIQFERNQALLDKDFQLYYAVGDNDLGFTMVAHRPVSSDKGYFLLLVTPRVEQSKDQVIPRDMLFVLDTSGSMRGPKMDQAKRALKYCLDNLNPRDRFGILNFATTVNRYTAGLVDSTKEQTDQAKKWVDALDAAGGTAINDALAAALELRGKDTTRTFTVVFFTDGQPTIGETNVDRILKNFAARNTATTRVFTFGVGHDVNATMLDQIADQTRAVSTYVRPEEDIEAKVSGLHAKISRPVLANLRLSVNNDLKLEEIYPPQLPDLFHGGQLVVLGRYAGKGHAAVTLSGTVGGSARDFVYEMGFADKTNDERAFVEHLWARRKVGYVLDQIRANGEKKELVEEVTTLAKKYGIATPYTSYLIVPDGAVPVAGNQPVGPGGGGRGGLPDVSFGLQPGAGFGQPGLGGVPGGLPGAPGAGFGGGGAAAPRGPDGKPQTVLGYIKSNAAEPRSQAELRGRVSDEKLKDLPAAQDALKAAPKPGAKAAPQAAKSGEAERAQVLRALEATRERKEALDQAAQALQQKKRTELQAGRLGVMLSVDNNANNRNAQRLQQSALRQANSRNCLEINGIWVDEGYEAKMPTVTVKAQSEAYFRILERQPKMKEVFQLGNHLVWVTPNNTALVIDTGDGKEKLTDEEIDKLFAAKK